MFSKKAQVGETMTWVVGTIIIIIILAISIFIVSSSIYKADKKIQSKKTSSDLLVTKSFLGYLLTNDNFNELKNQKLNLPTDSISKSEDELVKKIFINLYEEEYSGNIWLGVVKEQCAWKLNQPSCAPNERRYLKGINAGCLNIYYNTVKLNTDSIAELLIGCKK